MMYVIHKKSRVPGTESYSGVTWDKAGIRDKYQAQYDSPLYALLLAKKLSQHNPVGFTVSGVSNETNSRN